MSSSLYDMFHSLSRRVCSSRVDGSAGGGLEPNAASSRGWLSALAPRFTSSLATMPSAVRATLRSASCQNGGPLLDPKRRERLGEAIAEALLAAALDERPDREGRSGGHHRDADERCCDRDGQPLRVMPDLRHLVATGIERIDGAEEARANDVRPSLEPRALLVEVGFRAHAMCSFSWFMPFCRRLRVLPSAAFGSIA